MALAAPGEPSLKASRVASVQLGRLAAREQKLKLSWLLVNLSCGESDLVANLERVDADRAVAHRLLSHHPCLQGLAGQEKENIGF